VLVGPPDLSHQQHQRPTAVAGAIGVGCSSALQPVTSATPTTDRSSSTTTTTTNDNTDAAGVFTFPTNQDDQAGPTWWCTVPTAGSRTSCPLALHNAAARRCRQRGHHDKNQHGSESESDSTAATHGPVPAGRGGLVRDSSVLPRVGLRHRWRGRTMWKKPKPHSKQRCILEGRRPVGQTSTTPHTPFDWLDPHQADWRFLCSDAQFFVRRNARCGKRLPSMNSTRPPPPGTTSEPAAPAASTRRKPEVYPAPCTRW
jgi:hypothetical protein